MKRYTPLKIGYTKFSQPSQIRLGFRLWHTFNVISYESLSYTVKEELESSLMNPIWDLTWYSIWFELETQIKQEIK